MSQQYINIGATPNDGLGDPIRTAFQKTNENFSELYANSGNGGGNANTGNITFSNITIQGTGDEYGYSGLYLAPGPNSLANLQYLRVRGGDYPTHLHFDTGNNVFFDQYFGADSKFVKLEANGNIVINADDYAGNSASWTFDTAGNLIVPGTIVGAYGNLQLQPDLAIAGSYLDIFLTSGPDLHLVASANANLILGKDNQSNVRTSWDGNVTVQSWDNGTGNAGGTWTFGGSGNLTLPTGAVLGDVYGDGGASLQSPASSYAGINSNNQQQWVEADDVNVYVGVAYGTGQDKQWQFNYNGNLTLPTGGNLVLVGGNIVGNGASPAPSINGFSTISAVTLSATGNIQGNYIFGNGTFLTGISGAGNPSANALTGNTLTANVTISSLTQVGTLGNLSVSGNTTSGNLLTSGLVSVTGNAQAGNILTVGVISSTGNAVHGNILTAGVISSTGNAVHGNILTSGIVSATGNIYTTNFIGNLSNGTSKISIASSGNVSVGVGPFSTTVLNINTSTGISILGNVVASQSVSAIGNVYSNGNIAMVSNLPRNTYVANVAPTAGQGNIGDIWYQTF